MLIGHVGRSTQCQEDIRDQGLTSGFREVGCKKNLRFRSTGECKNIHILKKLSEDTPAGFTRSKALLRYRL